MPNLTVLALLAVAGGVHQAPNDTGAKDFSRLANRLSFVANKGQWNPEAKFLARTPDVNVWITNHGITYDFHQIDFPQSIGADGKPAPSRLGPEHGSASGQVVQVQFEGSQPSAHAVGNDRQQGLVNYLHGDVSTSATNVPLFGSTQIQNLYPGIDAVVYQDRKTGGPRYDIVVAPGADLTALRMRYYGATNLRLNSHGDLTYDTVLGSVVEKGLRAYQVDATGAEHDVSVTPKLDHGALTYEVPQRDASQKLIIDPLIYSTYVGGSGYDDPHGMALDSNGNAYVTGVTYSSDYPTTAGAYRTDMVGYEVYVTKYNADGSDIEYSTFIGGSSSDYGYDVAVDANGNAYVTGYTYSQDFPTKNAFMAAPSSTPDAFVTKLNAAGSNLVWSTYLGGTSTDVSYAIAVDPSGRVYVTGYTYSTDFPKKTAFQTARHGSYDAFVTRFGSDGSLGYSTYLGGSSNNVGWDIAVDAGGHAVVTGATSSSDFPTLKATQATFMGGEDAFVTQMSLNGSAVLFSTFLGGTSSEEARSVCYDADGSVYVGGYTYSTDFPHDNVFGSTVYGGFVTKYRNDGKVVIYSDVLTYCYIYGVAVDSSNRACAVGYSYGSLSPTPGCFQYYYAGSSDAFLSRLAVNGASQTYATYIGGNSSDLAQNVAVDADGNAYLYGYTYSSDYPVKAGSFDTVYVGGDNEHAFLSKIRATDDAVSIDPVYPVIGGNDASITVRIPVAAGSGGQAVTISGGGGVITPPATVTIPEGSTTFTFNASTKGVNLERIFNVNAKIGSTTATRRIALEPAIPDHVVITPKSVVGGSATSVTGKVVLNGRAGPGGTIVYLSTRFLPSSLSKATVPGNIIIPANATSATFQISHTATNKQVVCSVIATANGGSATGTLTIKP